MWHVLRQRDFGLLWFGGLISMAGDWMLRIALPAYVFQLTGSTLATGAMWIASVVPSIALGSVAGVFVDRWDRKRTMVITNLLLGICLLPLLLVNGRDQVWIVYVVAFVQGCIGQFFGPAEGALLPRLVGSEHLTTANALNALNNNLARLFGPALGGFAAVVLGLHGVALIDAATYIVAAALIGLIRTSSQLERVPSQASVSNSWRSLWHEWREGLHIVRHNRLVTILFVIAACMALGEGVLSVLFVPWATAVLRGDALVIGWLMSAQAVGGLLGGLVIARFGAHVSPRRLLVPGAIGLGMIDLLILNYPLLFPGVAIAIGLFVAVGIPVSAFLTSFNTLLQGSVSDAYRGRMFGAYGTLFSLVMLIGMLIASAFGDLLGILPMINLLPLGYIASGLVALLFVREADVVDSVREPQAVQA